MDVAALSPSVASLTPTFDRSGSSTQPAKTEKVGAAGKTDQTQTNAAQQAEVRELQKRDREVRAHESAHVAAGGSYVRGGASFQFVTGPDGRLYATGGEVSIDTSSIPDDPEATILKMQTVRRAALAPAQPSSQDRSVAASASQAEAQAQMELTRARLTSGETPPPGSLINDYA
jgi:hypothetical protein